MNQIDALRALKKAQVVLSNPEGIYPKKQGEALSLVESAIKALDNPIKREPSPEELSLMETIAGLTCRDGSCHFWPPGLSRGMCTQGGCRCFEGDRMSRQAARKVRHMMQLWRHLFFYRTEAPR
jgi:hypothetical protein